MTKSFSNVCPRDCFGSCRIRTVVNQGKIVELTGFPKDTYTHGALCAKGYAYHHLQESADRVLYPMKQTGRGSGNWKRLSWEEALGEIADRLIKIKTEEKTLLPVCLNKYLGNTGVLNGAVEAFFRSIGYVTFMVGTPCDSAGIDALILSYGASRKPRPEDMVNSRLILIWGANPAWTASHQMRYVYEARARGAKIVVIDPQYTATAARSDLYVEVKPGGDGYLALGMAKTIVLEGLTDDTFLKEATLGWEPYRTYLLTVEWKEITEGCGLEEQDIRELARLYAGVKPSTIWLGIGAQHHPSGGQNFRIIDSLAALTGNIGISGGNVHYAVSEIAPQVGNYSGITPPPGSKGWVNPSGIEGHRRIGTGRNKELASLTPPVRLLWVSGRNPIAQDPESKSIRKVFQQIETIVVTDQRMTATAGQADFFLPVSTFFEYEDVVISNWHYGVAINQKAMEPAGESRTDYWIVRELARMLNERYPGFSTFPTELEPHGWLDLVLEPYYSGWGIKHYRELAIHQVQLDFPDVPWKDHRFLTPSGKYEFYSERAKSLGVPEIPIPAQVQKSTSAYPLQLLSVRSYASLNSQFPHLSKLLTGEGSKLLIHPHTALAKGIEEGRVACVYNALGEIRLPVLYTYSVPYDVLVVYVGMTNEENKVVNSLLDFREADLGTLSSGVPGLSFQSCYVNITRSVGHG
ncbi:molybdopterin-dependent oxidoreductase [Brevibacillus ginsengisoli]|uniref:molybdopterin-dependent oxidoreductase n=1 Tax=Brevibacillus ginsengisoli TaxID=363854 RepID=UPI003CF9D1A7